jgi:hypothetical protein
LLGIFAALLTIFGTIIQLDINAYFHPEAALLLVGGLISYVLSVNNKENLRAELMNEQYFLGG